MTMLSVKNWKPPELKDFLNIDSIISLLSLDVVLCRHSHLRAKHHIEIRDEGWVVCLKQQRKKELKNGRRMILTREVGKEKLYVRHILQINFRQKCMWKLRTWKLILLNCEPIGDTLCTSRGTYIPVCRHFSMYFNVY